MKNILSLFRRKKQPTATEPSVDAFSRDTAVLGPEPEAEQITALESQVARLKTRVMELQLENRALMDGHIISRPERLSARAQEASIIARTIDLANLALVHAAEELDGLIMSGRQDAVTGKQSAHLDRAHELLLEFFAAMQERHSLTGVIEHILVSEGIKVESRGHRSADDENVVPFKKPH